MWRVGADLYYPFISVVCLLAYGDTRSEDIIVDAHTGHRRPIKRQHYPGLEWIDNVLMCS